MTFLEEIAQRIDKALDGDCGYGVGGYLADQIAPLIAEHDAKVQAEALREAAEGLESGIWPEGDESGVKNAAREIQYRAARIEREAGL